MYSTEQCNLPNSSTPMSQARINAQDAYVASVGSKFTSGNQALANIIAVLTPPVPSGSCSDFTSSASMHNVSPFPDYPVTGAVLPPNPGLGRVRRRGMGQTTQWPQMLPTGTYATPQPGFQLDISSLIPVWGCTAPSTPVLPGGGLPPAAANATLPNPGPTFSPSVAGQSLPQTSASCWPWPCLLIVLAGIAMLLPSPGKKKTEEHHRRKTA